MTYLIDTDVVAYWLKGRPEEITLLDSLAPHHLAVSLITYGEIYEGVYYGYDPKAHEQTFRQFLRGVKVVPLTKLIMRCFARIRGELRRKGNIISDNDIMIAATALHYHYPLLTYNRRHFERIPDLALYPPLA